MNHASVDKLLGKSRHRDGALSDICRYTHDHILVSVDMGVRSRLLVIGLRILQLWQPLLLYQDVEGNTMAIWNQDSGLVRAYQ